MRRLLLITGFILFAAYTNAQDRFEDVVYLKDGKIIRGILIKSGEDYIKIESASNLFVLQMTDVDKITREKATHAALNPYENNTHKARLLPPDQFHSLDSNFTYGKSIYMREVSKIYCIFLQDGRIIDPVKALANLPVCDFDIRMAVKEEKSARRLIITGFVVPIVGYFIVRPVMKKKLMKSKAHLVNAVKLYNNALIPAANQP